MKVYKLINDNIIMAAGGPMGSSTVTRWTLIFKKRKKAKKAAYQDYGSKFKWSKFPSGNLSSPDLSHTQYSIIKVKVK